MEIKLAPFLDKNAPPCCKVVLVDGGERSEDRGAWCRTTGRLVIDGAIVAVGLHDLSDVISWAKAHE